MECNCSYQSSLYEHWRFAPGQLFQCHSDGGVKRCGKAAVAYTLCATYVTEDGVIQRTLLRAEGVYIDDVEITAPKAERIALTEGCASYELVRDSILV